MTQQQSPDGQTPPSSSDPGTQSNDSEALRNVEDAKKAFKARDEAKAAAKAAAAELAAAREELAALRGEKMKASGDLEGLLAAERKAREEAEKKAAELSSGLEQRTRQDRRREIVDTILEHANPQRKEELRLMLSGLHESGDVDLYAEDAKAEGKKALDKLRKRLPAHFAPAGSADGATPRGPGRDLTGVDWMQLSPEEQRNLSDEDFRKHFGGRGAGRRKSALFG